MGLVPKEIDTKVYTITNHPHVFIANLNHPLTKLRNIQPEVLKDFDFISREKGSGTRAHMETFINDHGIQPNIIMEMSSNESIKQAVIAELGISFVSQHTIASELKNGQLKVLDVINTPINRKWHVVTLNPMSINRSVDLLKDFINKYAEKVDMTKAEIGAKYEEKTHGVDKTVALKLAIDNLLNDANHYEKLADTDFEEGAPPLVSENKKKIITEMITTIIILVIIIFSITLLILWYKFHCYISTKIGY
jgi:hypothetical protein